jgi:hypothetical protein
MNSTLDRPLGPITHGTMRGYRRCPTKCAACLSAVRDYDRNRRPSPSARRRAGKAASEARRRWALGWLSLEHPDDYRRLLTEERGVKVHGSRDRALVRLARMHRGDYLRKQYQVRQGLSAA